VISVIEFIPASSVTLGSGTFADLVDGSANRVESTFVVSNAVKCAFAFTGQFTGHVSGAWQLALRLVVDQGGFGGFTAQTLAPTLDDRVWSLLETVNGSHSTVSITTHTVNLAAGTHQLTVQYRLTLGSSATFNTDDFFMANAIVIGA